MIYVDENLKNGNGGCIISNTEGGGYSLSVSYCGSKMCKFIIKTVNTWCSIGFDNNEFNDGWNRLSSSYDGNCMKLYLNGILKDQKKYI